MIIAKLTESRWLQREFDVFTPEGLFKVVYFGKGLGYEEITVNGEVASRKSSHFWYAPEFYFTIGNYSALIEVSVGLSMTISSFNFGVDGHQVYFEGKD